MKHTKLTRKSPAASGGQRLAKSEAEQTVPAAQVEYSSAPVSSTAAQQELKPDQLKPQVAVLLFDLRGVPLSSDEILGAMESEAPSIIKKAYKKKADVGQPTAATAFNPPPETRLTIGVVARAEKRDWTLCGHWYAVRTTPPWIKQLAPGEAGEGGQQEGLFEDVRHHLSLLLLRRPNAGDPFAVLLITDSLIRTQLAKLLDAFHIPCVAQEELEHAFLRGASRQLWLRGIHRPTRVKPDTKGLVGLDLREAIDPFGDQSFRIDAAVSDPSAERSVASFHSSLPPGSRLREMPIEDVLGRPPKGGRGFVGLSLRSGLVWTRSTVSIDDLLRELDELCKLVEDARKLGKPEGAAYEQPGYEVLARPQYAVSLEALGDACDFSFEFAAPLLMYGEDLPTFEIEAEREWLENGAFDVVRNENERLFVGARIGEREIAILRLQPVLQADGRVELNTTVEPANGVSRDDQSLINLDYVLQRFENRAAVWFSAGFSIQAGRIFSVKYRDVPFDRWRWLPFSNGKKNILYEVWSEKPADSKLWEVRWDGRSLFEFVVNNAVSLFSPSTEWYLLCDDRSGEIADFVFIDPEAKRLKLVHVKAADETVARKIAPAKYEVVVSQATKNLRFLEPSNLVQRFRLDTGRVKELTWKNGSKLLNRDEPIRALESMGQYLDRGVIVLQPHTKRSTWLNTEQQLRQGLLGPGDRIQFLRLRTLLADIEDVCRRFDASFECWGEYDPNDDCKEEGIGFPRASLQ